MSILNVDQISPIGSGSTITVTATETKTGAITIGTGSSIFSPAGNTLVLGTNNLERIRIKNDGKVGVGTNNPTAKLEIKGSDNPLVKIVQDTSGIARLNLESATNDGYQYSGIGLGDGTNDAELMWTTGGFDVNVGNAVRLRINSNGAWGAGTNFGSAGQVLTSQGSGSAVQWANAVGITEVDHWYLPSSWTTSGAIITSWQRFTTANVGAASPLGTGMSFSSGNFTFPSTGKWLVIGTAHFTIASNDNCLMQTKVTVDNSNYYVYATLKDGNPAGSMKTGGSTSFAFVDVTDTSNVKLHMFAQSLASGSQLDGYNSGDGVQTSVVFIRLGDT